MDPDQVHDTDASERVPVQERGVPGGREGELGEDSILRPRVSPSMREITAADAVCGIRLGKRSGRQNHEEVLGLLDTAGANGKALVKELGRLLPLKTKAEYDPVDVSRQTRGGL